MFQLASLDFAMAMGSAKTLPSGQVTSGTGRVISDSQ